jgi:hypothetical protein
MPFGLALVLVGVVFSLLVGLSFFEEVNFSFFRAIATYLSFFMSAFFYLLYKRRYKSTLSIIYFFNIIWLLAGIIQLFFGKDSLSFLLHFRTTENRGVTGLAPEPTFYGIYLYFISWLLLVESEYKPSKRTIFLVSVNLLFLVFVVKSSMALLYVFITLFVVLVINFYKLKVLILVCGGLGVGAIVFFLLSGSLEGTRVSQLAGYLVEGPVFVAAKDASVNDRLSHIYFSFKGAFDSFLLPNGFSSFGDYIKAGKAGSDFFWYGANKNTIMSGLGMIVYELGLASIFIIGGIFLLLVKNSSIKLAVFNVIMVFVLFLSAVPVSFPLVSMLIVSIYHYNQIKNEL